MYSARCRVYRFSENPLLFCGTTYEDAKNHSGLQRSAETACSAYPPACCGVWARPQVCLCMWLRETYKLRHCSLFPAQSWPTSISTPTRKQSILLTFRWIPTLAKFLHLHMTSRPDNALMNRCHLNRDLGWTGFYVLLPLRANRGRLLNTYSTLRHVLQNTVITSSQQTCINAPNFAANCLVFCDLGLYNGRAVSYTANRTGGTCDFLRAVVYMSVLNPAV